MSTEPVITRFAPSPTGALHVGNVRSALFSWLFARRHGGKFLLRIEDTDRKRHIESAVEVITGGLQWLGLTWDGPIVRQSERFERYRQIAFDLHRAGHAYWTYRVGSDDSQSGNSPDERRDLGPGPGRALRFRIPPGRTAFTDIVRGDIRFDHDHLEDFVLLRADGSPTFILAVTVDDADSGVTHIVRGEEHLVNMAKQLLLWDSVSGLAPPASAHLPLIVNAQRQKLSKRRDKVALDDFRREGYLPQAMVNYLALLGWAPKHDREVIPVEEMIAEFDLSDVKRASAFFDVVKLRTINAIHVRALALKEFENAAAAFLDPSTLEAARPLLALAQERVTVLSELPNLFDFLSYTTDEVPLGELERLDVTAGADASAILAAAEVEYSVASWNSESLLTASRSLSERLGIKLRHLQAPIRIAITGARVGLPLFDAMEHLGRAETLARINRARRALGQQVEDAGASR